MGLITMPMTAVSGLRLSSKGLNFAVKSSALLVNV